MKLFYIKLKINSNSIKIFLVRIITMGKPKTIKRVGTINNNK